MFLLTILVCITMPKNVQVEGSSMALATANAKELAGMKEQIPIIVVMGIMLCLISFILLNETIHFQEHLLRQVDEKFDFEIHEATECDLRSH